MEDDPIVAEVHRIRDVLAAKFNYDMEAFFADIRRRQESLGSRLVRSRKDADSSQGKAADESRRRTG
jgi:hypothetical protein